MRTAMSLPPRRDTTIVAYLDEPPFAISGRASERPSGCDMDLALHVLKGVDDQGLQFFDIHYLLYR